VYFAPFDRLAERFAGSEQVFLAYEFFQRPRAHAIGQRAPARYGGFEERRLLQLSATL
jgi:hypothetical protein